MKRNYYNYHRQHRLENEHDDQEEIVNLNNNNRHKYCRQNRHRSRYYGFGMRHQPEQVTQQQQRQQQQQHGAEKQLSLLPALCDVDHKETTTAVASCQIGTAASDRRYYCDRRRTMRQNRYHRMLLAFRRTTTGTADVISLTLYLLLLILLNVSSSSSLSSLLPSSSLQGLSMTINRNQQGSIIHFESCQRRNPAFYVSAFSPFDRIGQYRSSPRRQRQHCRHFTTPTFSSSSSLSFGSGRPRHHPFERLRLWESAGDNRGSSIQDEAPAPARNTLDTDDNDDDDDDEAGGLKDKKLSRKLRKLEEYNRRREEWLQRYGSLDALLRTFGDQKGDLSAQKTRELYHTLLPRSLLGLYEMDIMDPSELAPLAFQARIAAKQYARYRCWWVPRVLTELYDRYRDFKAGRTTQGVTWDELYQKYEVQIVREECLDQLTGKCTCNEPELTMRIYRRILEKSCSTNKAIDKLFLSQSTNKNNKRKSKKDKKNGKRRKANTDGDQMRNGTVTTGSSIVVGNDIAEDDDQEDQYLKQIAIKLESDIRQILLPPQDSEKLEKKLQKIVKKEEKQQEKEEKQQEKVVETFQKAKEKVLKIRNKQHLKRQKEESKEQEEAQHRRRREKEENMQEATDRPQQAEQEQVLAAVEQESRVGGDSATTTSLSTTTTASESAVQKGQAASQVAEGTSCDLVDDDSENYGRWGILRVMAGTRRKVNQMRQKLSKKSISGL